MDKKRLPKPRPSDTTLIDSECLQAAIGQVRRDASDEFCGCISDEPVLAEFLRRELVQICGKLSLAGARSGAVRGVAGDLHTILGIATCAFRLAYKQLLADFLPGDSPARAAPPPETPPQHEGVPF